MHATTAPATARHPAVRKFAQGLDGATPNADTVTMATRIVAAAYAHTTEPEFNVDHDGALAIDLRTTHELRLLAELTTDGTLDVGVYHDRNPGARAQEVAYLPNATADELIILIQRDAMPAPPGTAPPGLEQ